MKKREGSSKEVDIYISRLRTNRREILERLRNLVRDTVPEAEENMHYRMPSYHVGDEMICAFESQKLYVSLYLDSEEVDKNINSFGYLNVGNSCIRFKRFEDLPIDTVKAILRKTAAKSKKEN
jgi:uncharacterized protein YdhG (YjbR/CyaY superfamily)